MWRTLRRAWRNLSCWGNVQEPTFFCFGSVSARLGWLLAVSFSSVILIELTGPVIPSPAQYVKCKTMLNKRIALLFTIRPPLSGRQPISLVQQHFGGKFGSLTLQKEILKLEQFYHSELIYIETPGKLRTRHGYSTLCHTMASYALQTPPLVVHASRLSQNLYKS